MKSHHRVGTAPRENKQIWTDQNTADELLWDALSSGILYYIDYSIMIYLRI